MDLRIFEFPASSSSAAAQAVAGNTQNTPPLGSQPPPPSTLQEPVEPLVNPFASNTPTSTLIPARLILQQAFANFVNSAEKQIHWLLIKDLVGP